MPAPVAGTRARSIRPGALTTLATAAAVLSAVLLTGASSQAMTRRTAHCTLSIASAPADSQVNT
jgi:hypothetical protein